MIKEQYYQVPILNNEYWVYVYIGKDFKTLRKKLVKHFKDETIDIGDINLIRGRCFKSSCYVPYIIINTDKCKTNVMIFATLAHEACHAVDDIFTSIGDNNRDELFAHSVGAIIRGVK